MPEPRVAGGEPAAGAEPAVLSNNPVPQQCLKISSGLTVRSANGFPTERSSCPPCQTVRLHVDVDQDLESLGERACIQKVTSKLR